MTTTLPRWRFVRFASALLICGGLSMLQSASAPSARPIGRDNTCEGLTPEPPQSISKAVNHEDPASPDDDAPTGSDAAMAAGKGCATSLEDTACVAEMEADRRPFPPLEEPSLRGPPQHSPDPVDIDVADDEDEDDDDNGDSRNAECTTPVTRADRKPCLPARAEFLRASFITSGQSLRAPPAVALF